MHEITRIVESIEALLRAGRRGLLVTIAGTRGSTYRRAGARAVIAEEGDACGAISGGCVERDLAARAAEWLADMRPRIFTYDATRGDDIVFGLGLGCRGAVEMLVEPFDATHPPRILRDLQFDGRSPVLFATVIASTNPRYAIGDGFPIDGTFDRTCRIDVDGCDVLVDVIRPQRALVVFGGGADVEPVVRLATAAGFRVEAIRPRDVHPEEVARRVDLAAFDAAVVMTHNYLYDLALLEALLPSPIGYLGLLGPKTRGDELLAQLGDIASLAGDRVHSPIGLDLGGDTPEEIALSIVAEVQAVLQRRSGRRLRESRGPIHEPAPEALV